MERTEKQVVSETVVVPVELLASAAATLEGAACYTDLGSDGDRLIVRLRAAIAAAPSPAEGDKLEICGDGCWRPKARSADDCAAGCCSKWYAVRDPGAKAECEKLAAFWTVQNATPSPSALRADPDDMEHDYANLTRGALIPPALRVAQDAVAAMDRAKGEIDWAVQPSRNSLHDAEKRAADACIAYTRAQGVDEATVRKVILDMDRYIAHCMASARQPYVDDEDAADFMQQAGTMRGFRDTLAPAALSPQGDELERLRALVNSPELHDFSRGVVLEAGHQRERWGNDHDAGKEPADWFWLVGYLAGKALNAHKDGNTDKALHHTISTAAALANWHGAILGTTNMRPGIDGEAALAAAMGGQSCPQGVEDSPLLLATIGRKHFGNPIPREWYAAATELRESLSMEKR